MPTNLNPNPSPIYTHLCSAFFTLLQHSDLTKTLSNSALFSAESGQKHSAF
ncbi:hypothetical protein HanPSC8_Chr10g0429531 [Helianthus annuus]|nr:hypothetical protein HanPSC8_Chr10g0429531 [Helianthus annuus]